MLGIVEGVDGGTGDGRHVLPLRVGSNGAATAGASSGHSMPALLSMQRLSPKRTNGAKQVDPDSDEVSPFILSLTNASLEEFIQIIKLFIYG